MYREIEGKLKNWKEMPSRSPIILRGARQVGKTFTVEKFGNAFFENLITLNFEFQPELSSCFESLDPLTICSKIELFFNQRIIPGKTLLFFDEIQNCPKAILSLRYFKEKYPELHVITAGSLLEFTLHEDQFSFPVGRVQYLYLKPLSFIEFLMNKGRDKLLEYLQNLNVDNKVDADIHQLLFQHFRQYALIGGMPAVVKSFLETQSFIECQNILSSLLETYRSDFTKYASKTQYQYLQLTFEKVPHLIAQHFKYSHISSEYRSKEIKIALEQLEWAGLLQKVYATSASGVPLNAQVKEHKFKLLFLDIGLVNAAGKFDFNTILANDLTQINAGALAEQIVGQELLAYSNPLIQNKLFFWEREKKNSEAEVDFVIQVDHLILPVEVKAGKTGSLKSLRLFLEEKKQPFGIRISEHPLSFHDRILSVPFYLINQLPRLIDQVHK